MLTSTVLNLSMPPVLGAGTSRRASEPGVHSLWEWLEEHGTITYPLIALLIVGLIVGALISNWRSETLSAERRAELKRRIMQIMRKRVSGVSPEAVAAELQIELMDAAMLMRELTEEGMLSATDTQSSGGPARFRLRGVK